jgi:hypothetical protein
MHFAPEKMGIPFPVDLSEEQSSLQLDPRRICPPISLRFAGSKLDEIYPKLTIQTCKSGVEFPHTVRLRIFITRRTREPAGCIRARFIVRGQPGIWLTGRGFGVLPHAASIQAGGDCISRFFAG